MYKKKEFFLLKNIFIYFRTGFFILTPEYGLEFIANCRETGFHPHPTDPPLYTVIILNDFNADCVNIICYIRSKEYFFRKQNTVSWM